MIEAEEKRNETKRKWIKIICYIFLALAVIWFSLVLVEMYRVQCDKTPMICLNEVKDVEDDDEYSLTCYGILYKYREYHFKSDDSISAREFTLVFKEFERKLADKK